MEVREVRGVLRDNFQEDRLGIWSNGDWYIEGLHCGMCFDALYHGEWVPVRIEFGPANWYLVGLEGVDPRGLEVRYRG